MEEESDQEIQQDDNNLEKSKLHVSSPMTYLDYGRWDKLMLAADIASSEAFSDYNAFYEWFSAMRGLYRYVRPIIENSKWTTQRLKGETKTIICSVKDFDLLFNMMFDSIQATSSSNATGVKKLWKDMDELYLELLRARQYVGGGVKVDDSSDTIKILGNLLP
jgi:hypothetical protein